MQDIIINICTLLFGGGIGWLINWRANQRKAEAEAMSSVQDVYQQALADQQNYINKLKDNRDQLALDRDEMRRENNELRRQLNELEEKIRQLENAVARNGRVVASLRPFLCGRINCGQRTSVDLGDSSSDSSIEK